MDCGPTCLKMIARYYGKNYSLQFLRNKTFINRGGVSLTGISEAAEAIGFRTISVQLPFEKLQEGKPFPCIVHWNENHFVVVHQVTKDKVYVADPAIGMIHYSIQEFERSWASALKNNVNTGIALLLEPLPVFYEQSEDEANTSHQRSLSSLLGYVVRYKRFLLQLALGLLLGSLIQLILPFLTQSLVDVGIHTRNIGFIYLVLAGQIVLFISRTSVDFIRRWILLQLGARINISIVSDFLIKIMKLPLSFFDSRMIGDLLQRIEDHTRIEKFLNSSSLSILFSLVNLIIFGIVLVVYDVSIFLVFFSLSIIYVCYVLVFSKRRAELDYKRFNQRSNNQSNLIQLIYGVPEIKLNNCETQKRWEWERIQARLFKLNTESMKLLQYQDSGGLFINEFKNIIITYMTAVAVIEGEMTLGMMLAVQYIIGQLNAPVKDFINFTRELQDARISLNRIREVHAMENEDRLYDEWHSTVMPEKRSITLQNVSFGYEGPNSPTVLDSINLTIPEGKITALVGASGSGKTTLLKLLLKFYQPSRGQILLGEADIRNVASTEWRKQCGVVMQDGYMFADTIARNVALSDEVIDKKRLLHAVQVANILEFIESLPLGFNTKVGSNGVGLSQGQKQRLLIARAVYKNPDFLVFDEATSALDATNERVIMENLNRFFQGKTVLIIAHRLSTVKNAHQIVVLDHGKAVEVGSHVELTEARGTYFNLVKNQLELGT